MLSNENGTEIRLEGIELFWERWAGRTEGGSWYDLVQARMAMLQSEVKRNQRIVYKIRNFRTVNENVQKLKLGRRCGGKT